MEEKELLTKKFILVGMNGVDISTDEKHIIGTGALAACTGLLLYNPVQKRAIVAHLSRRWIETIKEAYVLAQSNGFLSSPIQYLIITGGFHTTGQSKDVPPNELEDYIQMYFRANKLVPTNTEYLQIDLFLSENEKSYCFAFDALSGNFVSDQVLYGAEYEEVNNQKKY